MDIVPTNLEGLAKYIEANKMFDMVKFPSIKVNGFDGLDILSSVGLPNWCAPHLNFGEFEDNEWLPKLNEWSWAETNYPECFHHYVVLGSQDDPICYKGRNEPIVMITSSQSEQYFNSDIVTMLYTIVCVSQMIDKAIVVSGDEVITGKTVPKILARNVLSLIRAQDLRCAELGSFWYQALKELSLNG